MSWFLCTIARTSVRNWDLCKEVGLWGVSTHAKKTKLARAREGDRLLVWQSGKGYIATAAVLGPTRPPASAAEAPWPEGLHRYGLVIPIAVDMELERPLYLRFEKNIQERTGLSSFQFRRGFVAVRDDAASAALEAMQGHPTAEADQAS
ncbi:hypothetical protein [Serinicoccus marinus]|uniref:hypothetical protein n=1 Tax=Serinicoccus marinus TaxID=247333 RepID=UPI00122E2C10|nr:hypothetical protein [Serinicoccus marinus]